MKIRKLPLYLRTAYWKVVVKQNILFSSTGEDNHVVRFTLPTKIQSTTMGKVLSKYRFAIYLDSRDGDTLTNVFKWFDNGFFSPSNCVIIFRAYPNNFTTFASKILSQGVDYVCYNKFSAINLQGIAAVFYPFNTNTNPLLMRNRNVKHVFIGHGESDKIASVNPMLRMYDYIFVSGKVSIERLVSSKIISQHDARNGKCLKIATPYIPPSDCEVGDARGVLYAPTWEGATQEQAYSSLPIAKGIVSYLLESGLTVYFQPHPSSGAKHKEYLNLTNQLIKEYADNHNFVVIPTSDRFQTLNANALDSLEPTKFNSVVTDISSMGIWALALNKNLLTYVSEAHRPLLDSDLHLSRQSELVFTDLNELENANTHLTARKAKGINTHCIDRENYLSSSNYDSFLETISTELRW